jgi:hypothetical protein
LWAALCNLLSISHSTTTALNGLMELFLRRLKVALHARAAATNWCGHLP